MKQPLIHNSELFQEVHIIDSFDMFKNKFQAKQVKFTKYSLIINTKNSTYYILNRDIVGIKYNDLGDKQYQIIIYYMEKNLESGCFSATQLRKLKDQSFLFTSNDDALKFQNLVRTFNPNNQLQINNLNEFQEKKVLVFLNPVSGTQQAKKEFQIAKEIFRYTNIKFKLIETERKNHVNDFIKICELSELKQFDGIVICSGDGLIHEYINAIYQRQDYKDVMEIPLGIIPGGTSNALMLNLCDSQQEISNTITACYFIAKGQTQYRNLLKLETEQNHTIYSFLSVNYGIISDIDIGSEFLRMMGRIRYDIYGAWRAISLNRYKCQLSLSKKIINDLPKFQENLDNDNYEIIKDNFGYFSVNLLPIIDSTMRIIQNFDLSDYKLDIQHLSGNFGSVKIARLLLSLNNQSSHLNFVKSEKCNFFRLTPLEGKQSIFSIDGESYQAQTIQGIKIMNGYKVFC